MNSLTIRTCRRADLDLLLSWAKAEGWNPGLYDARPFQVADPQGFFLGCLGEQPVAGVSAVRYGPNFGFLGLYIVVPDQRGRGHGKRVWDAALEHLRGVECVGLDGVVAQQDNYGRSGFALAYRQIRFGGPAPAAVCSTGLVDVGAVPFDALASYDRVHFGAPRESFLTAWLAQPESLGLTHVEAGQVQGYGVRRRCHQGYKIGPLFADTPLIARRLLESLCSDVAGQPIFLDVPEPNQPGTALAESAGLRAIFETARMYKGRSANLPVNRIFGVTTFELG